MIIDKLRYSTAEIHRELDSWLTPVIKSIDTKEKYSILLSAFYGYYAPVMTMIDVEIDTRYLPDFSQRRRPDIIIDDLDSINCVYLAPKPALILPDIHNASHAFGALYVLEGSTLGGVFLSKLLAENMQISTDRGIRFFSGYGKASHTMWNTFIQHITRFANEKGDEEAILNAASDTFKYFKHHLQQHLQYN